MFTVNLMHLCLISVNFFKKTKQQNKQQQQQQQQKNSYWLQTRITYIYALGKQFCLGTCFVSLFPVN